jgi:hypothetical protein
MRVLVILITEHKAQHLTVKVRIEMKTKPQKYAYFLKLRTLRIQSGLHAVCIINGTVWFKIKVMSYVSS